MQAGEGLISDICKGWGRSYTPRLGPAGRLAIQIKSLPAYQRAVLPAFT